MKNFYTFTMLTFLGCMNPNQAIRMTNDQSGQHQEMLLQTTDFCKERHSDCNDEDSGQNQQTFIDLDLVNKCQPTAVLPAPVISSTPNPCFSNYDEFECCKLSQICPASIPGFTSVPQFVETCNFGNRDESLA